MNGHMNTNDTGGEPVAGRILWKQISYDGQGYLHTLLVLGNQHGQVRVWCAPTTLLSTPLDNWIACTARGYWCAGHSGPLYAADQVNSIDQWDNAAQLLPISECPLPDLLPSLVQLVDDFQTPVIKNCLNKLLSMPAIARPLMALPASRQHHHAYPGGLLKHSLECARLAAALLPDQSVAEKELVQLAALVHDIGKIRTLERDGQRSELGFAVDHDTLTLEMLAPILQALEQDWYEGAVALRTLLQHRHPRWNQAPRYPACEAIRAADRMSASQGAANQAFEGLANWRNLSEPLAGDRYWRLVSAS